MARIHQAPTHLSSAEKKAATTLYLAGPFEPKGPSWRDEVIEAVDDLDVIVIDPRNERWPDLEAGSPGRRGAYDWQTSTAYDADVVIVWVPDGSHAPTALMILGYLAAKRGNAKKSGSVVVGGGGWDGLVQLFAQNHRFFPLGEDLDEVIRIARIELEKSLGATSSG